MHTVKGFGLVNKAEIDVFLELFCFFNMQQMLAIWSLVPLPFLKPAWTSGSSQFMYCWSLAWRTLSITLPTKVCLVKAMVFPVVMYGCESWTIKKAERRRTDAFELWCWRRLLRVPRTVRRSNQSVLKEINPRYSLEGLMLKLQYPLPHYVKSQFIWKDPDAGKDWGQEEKRATEDEMVGWHCQLNAHKFEPTRGASERQGSLMCCSPQGCKHD